MPPEYPPDVPPNVPLSVWPLLPCPGPDPLLPLQVLPGWLPVEPELAP